MLIICKPDLHETEFKFKSTTSKLYFLAKTSKISIPLDDVTVIFLNIIQPDRQILMGKDHNFQERNETVGFAYTIQTSRLHPQIL